MERAWIITRVFDDDGEHRIENFKFSGNVPELIAKMYQLGDLAQWRNVEIHTFSDDSYQIDVEHDRHSTYPIMSAIPETALIDLNLTEDENGN